MRTCSFPLLAMERTPTLNPFYPNKNLSLGFVSLQSDVPVHCLHWYTVHLVSPSFLGSISLCNVDIRIYP